MNPTANKPQQAMQAEQAKHTNQHCRESYVDPVQNWVSLRIASIGMRIEVDKIRGDVRMAFGAGFAPIGGRYRRLSLGNRQDVVRAVAVGARGRWHITQLCQLAMEASSVTARQLSVTIAASVRQRQPKGGRTRMRQIVCLMAIDTTWLRLGVAGCRLFAIRSL
jgi:hypothetical protein